MDASFVWTNAFYSDKCSTFPDLCNIVGSEEIMGEKIIHSWRINRK